MDELKLRSDAHWKAKLSPAVRAGVLSHDQMEEIWYGIFRSEARYFHYRDWMPITKAPPLKLRTIRVLIRQELEAKNDQR